MIFNADCARTPHQTFAIGFALLLHQLRMSSAKNDIDGVRAGSNDFGHGIEHGLNAFIRRQQTEGQNDHLPGEVEFGFGMMRFKKREIGYSVGYDLDLARWHGMNGTKEFMACFRHDDDSCRNIYDPAHHVMLGGGGFGEHRM